MARIGDRVAAIHGFRLVAGHSHRRATRYAGTLQVADRRATKIVDQPAGDAGVSAGLTPSPAKVLDTAAIWLNKHPGDDARLLALNRPDDFPLSLEDRAHLGREGKFAAVTILRLAGVEAQPTFGQIDVTPLPAQKLAHCTPTSYVRDRGEGSQVFGKVFHDRTILHRFKEALARVLDMQHLDLGTCRDFSSS